MDSISDNLDYLDLVALDQHRCARDARGQPKRAVPAEGRPIAIERDQLLALARDHFKVIIGWPQTALDEGDGIILATAKDRGRSCPGAYGVVEAVVVCQPPRR